MFILAGIMVAIAAFLNAKMDKYMIDYMNLSDSQKTLEYYRKGYQTWYSFDWRAKYENHVNGKKAYNKLFLKIGIKTRWLTDNCNDAWHFYKSCMIVLLCIAIAINSFSLKENYFNLPNIINAILITFVQLIALAFCWNIVFNRTLNNLRK